MARTIALRHPLSGLRTVAPAAALAGACGAGRYRLGMSASAEHDATRGRIRIESSAKRVRAYLGGELIADTIHPVLVWEVPYYPTYYFPNADVRTELLHKDDALAHSPSRGDGTLYTVNTGAREASAGALRYEQSPLPELRELIRLDWDAMDAWFEEDEEVFTHPRDPYTRVDILPSSRLIRVEVDGVAVAESSSPRILFETGLPVRYYLPKTHVRMDLLELTDVVTHCPYKGQAQSSSVRLRDAVHEHLAWCYPTPLPECQKIAGLMAFYDEKVDVFIDGVRQQRPSSKFS
jgi:uncharacterized protein (DUF427 family)